MLIVTGMHRSGTSFVAGALHELGVDLGERAGHYATDEWNPAGYFESLAVMVLNDRIVLGDALYVERFRTVEPGRRPWWARLVMTTARSRYLLMRNTAGVERRAGRKRGEIERLGREHKGMVVKDPRFCLTLSAWRRYAAVDGALLCYRHPQEVARSLLRRDRMPLPFGLRMWALHVEAFLAGAVGLPVTIVDYNRFFDPDRQLDELARCFAFVDRPFNGATARQVLERTLRSDLKHERAADAALPDRCRRLYEELHALHERHDRPRPLTRARPPAD